MMDIYEYDEVVLRSVEDVDHWADGAYFRGSPKSYIAKSYADRIFVNDDGRAHAVPHPNKAKKLPNVRSSAQYSMHTR